MNLLTLNNEMTIIKMNINEVRFIRREYIIPGHREFTVLRVNAFKIYLLTLWSGTCQYQAVAIVIM